MLIEIYAKILNWLLDLPRITKIIILSLVDFIIITNIGILSYVLRLDRSIFDLIFVNEIILISFIFAGIIILLNIFNNIYKEISRYSDFKTFYKLLISSILFVFIAYLIKYLVSTKIFIPRSIPLIIFFQLNLYFVLRVFFINKILTIQANIKKIKVVIFGINENIKSINYFLRKKKNI